MKTLIVESQAKAKKIQSYLGDDWRVFATGGHVQDLPTGPDYGKNGKKAYWANREGELPNIPWAWTDRGEKAVQEIIESAGESGKGDFYLAPDPDREGEFIAWRLAELLAPHGRTHRVTFNEVTKRAIDEAVANSRDIDMDLVQAAIVRRCLDRLVGFRASKIAKKHLPGYGAASMGRVQTPALGFIVDRELEREAHIPIPYFEVRVEAGGVELRARFHEPSESEVWRDEKKKAHPTRTNDRDLATRVYEVLYDAGEVAIRRATRKQRSEKPPAPFSTDTLLQAAGTRFGWSPGKTMGAAKGLYEAGLITYLRTDSTRLSPEFVAEARDLIGNRWGADHRGEGVKAAPAKGKVQDAHEAIRPTEVGVELPDDTSKDERRLYDLIYARALASQMAVARFTTVSLRCGVKELDVPLEGSVRWRTFPGWQAAFAEIEKPVAEQPPNVDLNEGASLPVDARDQNDPNPHLVEDETKPPPRLRAHTVIRLMKETGIGRPSTYASTVEKLKDRKYVEVEEGALAPTERGRAAWLDVAPLYETEDEALFKAAFTSSMESTLDRVEAGTERAPSVWEGLRDKVRQLHEKAREASSSGQALPKTLQTLQDLIDAAPDDFPASTNLDTLSENDAKEDIRKLRELGVQPRPTSSQLQFIRELAEQLKMSESEGAATVGYSSFEEIPDRDAASALIQALKERVELEKPPSSRQLHKISKLLEEKGLTEQEAVTMIGLGGMEELSGGRDGTASQLIDLLLVRSSDERD